MEPEKASAITKQQPEPAAPLAQPGPTTDFDWTAASKPDPSQTNAPAAAAHILPRLDRKQLGATPQAKRYGIRPIDYTKHLDGTRNAGDEYDAKISDREQRFVTELPKVVAQLNKVCDAKHYPFRFTEAELAVNFISEGGFYLLSPIQGVLLADQDIDGYELLGIDTFMQRLPSLEPWMSPQLKERSEDPSWISHGQNEKGQNFESLYLESLEQGLEANAVMFATAREEFHRHTKARGISVTSPEAWFFWTTVYYNAGGGTGLKLLQKHGVDYWKQKWTLPEGGAGYGRSVKYNATWRTATWDLLRTRLGDDLRVARNNVADVVHAHPEPAPAEPAEPVTAPKEP